MSKRLVTILLISGAVVAVGAVALGLSTVSGSLKSTTTPPTSAPASSSPDAKLTDGEGLQVEATFNRTASVKESLQFDIAMNTHSVELGQFDLAKLSQVVLEPGGVLTDFTWQPEGAGSGHHIGGTLIARDPKGLLASARSITLEIKGLPGPAVRRFEWKESK